MTMRLDCFERLKVASRCMKFITKLGGVNSSDTNDYTVVGIATIVSRGREMIACLAY